MGAVKGPGLWQNAGGSGRGGRGRARALALCVAAAAIGCNKPRIGGLAPDFTLPDASGTKVSLSGQGGKVVLLSFWATWCGPCQMELPELSKLKEELGEGVVLLIISDEAAGTTGPFLAERGIEAISLVDEHHEAFGSYDISGLPTLFVVDKGRIVREAHVGYARGQGEQIKKSVSALLSS